jgi:endo-1,3(4)-beta-glucanase
MGDVREFDGTSIKVPTQKDWVVGIEGLPDNLDNRKATSWDTQTVCLQYSAGASTMDTCLVPGSPYMTFSFVNAGIRIMSDKGEITEFRWITPGQKATATTAYGKTKHFLLAYRGWLYFEFS